MKKRNMWTKIAQKIVRAMKNIELTPKNQIQIKEKIQKSKLKKVNEIERKNHNEW